MIDGTVVATAAGAAETVRQAAQSAGPTLDHQAPAWVLLPLLVGAFVVAGAGYWRRSLARPLMLVSLSAFLAVCLAGLHAALTLGPLRYRMGGWPQPVGIELSLDALSAFVLVMIAVVALPVGVYAGAAVRREHPDREAAYLGMVLVLLLGLAGMVITADLFNLYVWLEVSSLGGYALMAVGHRKAVVSAFRYLLLGTLGASFYLLGVGYLYVLTGSLSIVDVAARIGAMPENPALTVSLACIVIGLGLKMALFPMHLWLPDAYTYASSTSTAIIAPLMTKVSAYALIRVLYFVYGTGHALTGPGGLGPLLVWMGLAGVVVGSVMAVAQTDVKRMLAYSSVAQLGYIGIGMALAQPLALAGAVLHILNHAVMKSCLFLVTGSVELQRGATSLGAYAGLGRRMPWTSACFTLAALAMVGVPPTNGFFSKWYLVLGGIAAGEWVVVAAMLASSLLTAVYFFRILERMWSRDPEDRAAARPLAGGGDPPLPMRAPMMALGAGVLVLGLANAWLVSTVIRHALPADLPWPL